MSVARKILFRVWSVYFHAGAWEGKGGIYEGLGIHKVARLMLGGYYTSVAIRRLLGLSPRIARGRRGAYEWLIFTMVAELGHGLFFLIMVAMSARYAAAGNWDDAVVAAIMNVVVNVMPMMVQRYNRARIVSAFCLDAAMVLDARLWVAALGLDRQPANTS
jgi:hypothetical protein